MISLVPHEVAFGGVFVPPLLVDAILGVVAAMLTARWMNKRRWSRHFYYSPAVFLALTVLYTLVFATLVVRA